MSAEEVDLDDLEVPDCPDDDSSLTERLDWHLNRVAWYRKKIAATEDQRDRMTFRYQQWCAKTTEPWRRKVAESEAFITYAHLDAIEADPKHPKVLHLPSGTVRTVAPRPSVVVEDPEAFRLWIASRGDDAAELARWKCEPNKEAVKKVLLDGEVVDGVRLEQGERKVSISVDTDDAGG